MFSPWLTVTHNKASSTIKQFDGAWAALSLCPTTKPLLAVMVGKRIKSEILRQFLRGGDDEFLNNSHGQIFMWPDPSSIGKPLPRIYVDFELQAYTSANCNIPLRVGPEVNRIVNWLDTKPSPLTRHKVNNLLCGRVLGPVSDIVCYFAADLGGMRAVASLLAEQICADPASDLPTASLPSILVVTETTSDFFDSHTAEDKFLNGLNELLRDSYLMGPEVDTRAKTRSHFQQIRVVGIRKADDTRFRARVVRKRLETMWRGSGATRESAGTLFTSGHLRVLSSKLLDHFCSSNTRPFSFVETSRAAGLDLNEFSVHLRELLSLMPSEAWLWHFVCPLLGSCIILASYPPQSHGMWIVLLPFHMLITPQVSL